MGEFPVYSYPAINMPLDDQTQRQIAQSLQLLKDVFAQDLLGFYLYGSAVAGGLQKYSDIDLFAVTDRPSTQAEKARMARAMLDISGVFLKSAKKPVELTIVVLSEVKPWRYPPTFDFQYGDWLREQFEAGEMEPWPSKEMPDLALLITQIFLASKTIFGAEPQKLLDRVPYLNFVAASTDELHGLLSDLDRDTRNVLLTLARIWSSLETDAIRSKPAAAAWAIEKLPPQYRPVIIRARAECLGEEVQDWDAVQALIRPCADFMIGKIERRSAFLKAEDTTQRSIHRAQE